MRRDRDGTAISLSPTRVEWAKYFSSPCYDDVFRSALLATT